MQQAINFPPYESFYSELKGKNVSEEDYKNAKHVYETRFRLPADHQDKMSNMTDWLRYYNLLDVEPLAKAISKSFGNFFTIFKMDPSIKITLPGYAQMCQFQSYCEFSPLAYSFGPGKKQKESGNTSSAKTQKINHELREIFRQSIFGGLVNCFHRMTDLTNMPGLPHAAQFAPDGSKFTRICFFDFNALYLHCQRLELPTTPGILWEKYDTESTRPYFCKRVLAQKCSLEAIQWLSFLEETCDDLVCADGTRVMIDHKYARGEKIVGEWEVDGYARVDGENIFFEYNGCYWHPCDECGTTPCGSEKDIVARVERWARKKEALSEQGKLVFIRGCQWKTQIKNENLRHYDILKFPHIMKYSGTEMDILNGIQSGLLFGFIIADIETPAHVLEEILPLNFPPVIIRGDITEDHLSQYMSTRVKDRSYKLPQTTLIQVYNAKQVLLFTPLVQFYMDLGLEISNVTRFIQYQPQVVLDKFVNLITNGRIQAKKDGNESLELAYKVIGNR